MYHALFTVRRARTLLAARALCLVLLVAVELLPRFPISGLIEALTADILILSVPLCFAVLHWYIRSDRWVALWAILDIFVTTVIFAMVYKATIN